MIEDGLSLFAVSQLSDIPTRLLACLGLGIEPDVAHAHVLQNVAALTTRGSFLGTCSLIPEMESYREYEDAVLYTQSQAYQDHSVINSSIVSAARGHVGNFHLSPKTKGSTLSISPLMSIYWFFDVAGVARQNLFLPYLSGTTTFMEAVLAATTALVHVPKRPSSHLTL